LTASGFPVFYDGGSRETELDRERKEGGETTHFGELVRDLDAVLLIDLVELDHHIKL
jgi:hypothetical protein